MLVQLSGVAKSASVAIIWPVPSSSIPTIAYMKTVKALVGQYGSSEPLHTCSLHM